MFRQLAGDYLYYLASRTGEGIKEGLNYHLSRNILTDNGVWKSSDDSLKVVGFASIMKDLLSKGEIGTRVPHVKLTAELHASGKVKAKKIYLDRLNGKENIIIFYTEGCHICEAEKLAARELTASDKKVAVLMVNVDEIMRSNPSLASKIFDAFDLSALPFIFEMNSKGLIQRRYMTLISR